LPKVRERQPGEFIQAALLLMGGGFAHPRWAVPGAPQRGPGPRPKSQDGAARLNVAIINRLRMGVDLHRLAAPYIGSSVGIEVMEGLVIGQLLDGTSREPDALIDGVLNDVARSGRSLLRDGKPLQNAAENRVLVGETVRSVLARRLPVLRSLGVID
jgi:hypothetical protein